MAIPVSLVRVLSAPTARDVWHLRADLLEAGLPADAPVWRVVRQFQHFLDQLATSTSSRDYSHLASMLDIGAVSGVVLERVLEPKQAEQLALSLFSGLLSEGLMVLGTRQHVKAWETELDAVYREAAWYLYEELWHWSKEQKPQLGAEERRQLLDRLLGLVHSDESSGLHKAVLLGRLFQILLVSYLTRENRADE